MGKTNPRYHEGLLNLPKVIRIPIAYSDYSITVVSFSSFFGMF
jgi:hypothetical protein